MMRTGSQRRPAGPCLGTISRASSSLRAPFFSHVGALLERQGRGNPLRLWGQRRGDRRSTDSHLAAEPAIGKNSLDDTKAYRDQMMGNNRPLGCLCDSVLVNYLGTSASRMQSLTCKSIEDRTTLC